MVCLLLPVGLREPGQRCVSCQPQQRQAGELVVGRFVPHIHQDAGQPFSGRRSTLRQAQLGCSGFQAQI